MQKQCSAWRQSLPPLLISLLALTALPAANALSGVLCAFGFRPESGSAQVKPSGCVGVNGSVGGISTPTPALPLTLTLTLPLTLALALTLTSDPNPNPNSTLTSIYSSRFDSVHPAQALSSRFASLLPPLFSLSLSPSL